MPVTTDVIVTVGHGIQIAMIQLNLFMVVPMAHLQCVIILGFAIIYHPPQSGTVICTIIILVMVVIVIVEHGTQIAMTHLLESLIAKKAQM